MKTVAGLPYSRLSCNRFSFCAHSKHEEAIDRDFSHSACCEGVASSRDSLKGSEELAFQSGATYEPSAGEGSLELITDQGLFDACGVRIAFTGRDGGVSEGPYAGLNLGMHVDDDPRCVSENRRRLLSALGAENASLVVPNQVHGVRIVTVDGEECVPSVQDDAGQGADGVEVLCNDVAALLCFADCMPVIVVAPSGAFAVVHAGWRGVYGHIAVSALSSLCQKTGCAPADCNVYLGPFIHPECFEVGEDLALKFSQEFGESCIAGYRHVDLEEAMRSDLVNAGADSKRIASAGICTVCNSSRFYSYRSSGGVCGRHGAIAVRTLR